ncbi:MAG: hypothetical protein UHS47_06740, partial [Oscillospiraceae bacterium]|nr:hypothetical protein [Oscillospiraceae bacterium]
PLEGRWAAARRLGRVENTDIAQYSHPSVTFGDSSPTGEPLERKLQFIFLPLQNSPLQFSVKLTIIMMNYYAQ